MAKGQISRRLIWWVPVVPLSLATSTCPACAQTYIKPDMEIWEQEKLAYMCILLEVFQLILVNLDNVDHFLFDLENSS